MLTLLLFICYVVPFSSTNNVDIEVSPIIKTGIPGSYFGFSATGVDDGSNSWVAVGSPKAKSSRLDNSGNETGALYKCPMEMNKTDCVDISKTILTANSNYEPVPADGWYGVSVAGGKRTENLLVCSHRLLVKYLGQTKYIKGVPGACQIFQRIDDFEVAVKRDYINRQNIEDLLNRQGDPDGTVSFRTSRFGQMGISSISALVNNKEKNFIGAVGERLATGVVVSLGKEYPASKQYSYGGYSVASGDFYRPGQTGLAIGAPRFDLVGAVYIHDTLDTAENVASAKRIDGPQNGSYFGMSMCASDFNGDGISEIVVGAPYYTKSLNKPASGQVYVYSSKNYAEPIVLKPEKTQANGLFGRSVAALGDVDRDGYNDLGIGEPYAESGGTLYIYHGSSTGLETTPAQIIRASDLPYTLKTFGWSIRGEVDLDGNGYPDVVVGAYTNDSIMILRALPVVNVNVSHQLNPSEIDVSNRNCTVTVDQETINTVCFNIQIRAVYEERAGKMSDDIELSFLLEADTLEIPKNRRVRFLSTDSPNLTVPKALVKSGRTSLVINRTAYLRTDQCPESECKDKIRPFPDIEFKLRTMLPDRPKPSAIKDSGSLPPLEKYFQLPYFTPVVPLKLPIKRACSGVCRPDLKITNIGTTNIPVKSRDVLLKVAISNTADPAYKVRLKVEFPPKLSARPCPKSDSQKCLWSTCEIKNGTEMICSLGTIDKERKEYEINVYTFEASNSLGTYDIHMNVSSGNPEETELMVDNMLTLELTVASKADIGIDGSTSIPSRYYGGRVRGQYSMTREEQIGLTVEHEYVVKNNGPDDVPEVNITIDWPYQAKSGKHLLYLLDIKEDDNIRCFPEPGKVNPLADQFRTITQENLNEGAESSRKRRDVSDDKEGQASPESQPLERKGSKSKIVLDCRNNTAMCIKIPCTVNLTSSKSVAVTLKSRIWNGTLLEDYPGQDVEVYSRARVEKLPDFVTDNITGNNEAKTKTTFFPASPKTTKKGIAPWIIAVSVVAGVVLLAILIAVFKMCGFFERRGAERYDSVPAEN